VPHHGGPLMFDFDSATGIAIAIAATITIAAATAPITTRRRRRDCTEGATAGAAAPEGAGLVVISSN
jgi:hypothetical protein